MFAVATLNMRKAAAAAFLLAAIAAVLGAVMPTDRALAQSNPERDRAFFDAAERGEIVVVRKLFAEGAQINWRDHRGRTPLLAATQRNRIDVARFLIQEGADVNTKDLIQDTPFLYAGAEGRTEIMRAILTAGPDLKDTNRFGGTALIPAAHRGHVETVKLLLATKIDKDHVNNLGWTALMEAVVLGDGGPAHTEIVRLLVAAGANTSIPDRDRITPLEHAKRRGYAEMVKILSAARR
jgi:ankyrin repeat protein